MDPRAIEKAKSRLRVAKKALSDLRTSETFGDFSDNWYVFLTSAKNIYTVLEQGSKTTPQSRQWFGAKKQIRKDDPLLQYLYEARNDDEHGLSSSVSLKPERHEIGVAQEGYSNSMTLNGGPFQDVTVTGCGTAVVFEGGPPPPGLRVSALDGKPVLTRRTPATTVLAEITARGNRIYSPPKNHFGQDISSDSPMQVASIAIAYLSDLLEEAERLE